MTTELHLLIWSSFLGFIQIMVAAQGSLRQRGMAYNMSSRDKLMPALTGVPGRLGRASENFKETFPLFLAAVAAVQLQSKNSSLSAWGAHLYFWGRLIYFPLYAFDITVFRTVVWFTASVGIILILCAAF